MSPMQSLPLTTTAEKRGNYPLNLRSCDFSCATTKQLLPPKKPLKVRTLNVAEAVTIIRNCHQTSKALGKKSAPLDWVRGLVITKLMSLAGQDINLIPCCCRPWTSLYTPQPHCGLLGLVFTTSPLRGIIIHFIYAQLEKDFPFHELFFITCMTKLETITLRSLKFAGQKI